MLLFIGFEGCVCPMGVLSLEFLKKGYVFTTLFGDETFVSGRLVQIDFMEDITIMKTKVTPHKKFLKA